MTTQTTAARMFGEAGSAVDELATDAEYELASRILDALLERSGRTFSPSQIARLAGVQASASDVHAVLPALVADDHVSVSGNGAWRRYRFVWG